jgi:hypothetical protein
MGAERRVPLAGLIDEVASQLLAAEQQAAKRDKPVMQFTECELEMAIAIEDEGQAGVKVWVFELSGGRTKTNSNTIRVKFQRYGEGGIYATEEEGAGPELGPGKRT